MRERRRPLSVAGSTPAGDAPTARQRARRCQHANERNGSECGTQWNPPPSPRPGRAWAGALVTPAILCKCVHQNRFSAKASIIASGSTFRQDPAPPAHAPPADALQAAQGRDRAQVHRDDIHARLLQVRIYIYLYNIHCSLFSLSLSNSLCCLSLPPFSHYPFPSFSGDADRAHNMVFYIHGTCVSWYGTLPVVPS